MLNAFVLVIYILEIHPLKISNKSTQRVYNVAFVMSLVGR